MKYYDVSALGEVLIDFTPAGTSEQGKNLYETNPGGAPANMLAMVSRLGGQAAFIGKVGRDRFGIFLSEVLAEKGVDVSGLRFTDDAATTLAFVELTDGGERSFRFVRKPGADMLITEEEIERGILQNTRVFHFGSLSLTAEPARSATLAAIKTAKQAGAIVSCDPNYRESLWPDREEAKRVISSAFDGVDILKLSRGEFEFFTGGDDYRALGGAFIDRGVKLLCVTLGASGCYYRTAEYDGYLPTYLSKVVDTTGAGDAFAGVMLHDIAKSGMAVANMGRAELEACLDRANAAGSLCAGRVGGVLAMPSAEEIDECLRLGIKLKTEGQ